MKNERNPIPLTSSEYFALMRLIQTLENEGYIPGDGEVEWQNIYSKLSFRCEEALEKKAEFVDRL